MRKGISQVIGAVMMIGIALSIAGVYAQWAPDFFENTARNATEAASNECGNAAIDIINPKYDKSTGTATFEVTNVGTITFFKDLITATLNNSVIIKKKNINGLEASGTKEVEFSQSEIPNKILVSSTECPGVKATETYINVTD